MVAAHGQVSCTSPVTAERNRRSLVRRMNLQRRWCGLVLLLPLVRCWVLSPPLLCWVLASLLQWYKVLSPLVRW